jgi:hypothetical protein
MVHEALPDPPHGEIRDKLADDGAARVDRAVELMESVIKSYNERVAGVVEARLRGPKARKHTRFWSDQVKVGVEVSQGGGLDSLTGQGAGLEYKTLDATYILPERTVDEIGKAVRPVGLRIVADAAGGVAKSLGRPNVGLAAFDRATVEAAVDSAVAAMADVAERHARDIRREILAADSSAESLDQVIDRILEAQRRGGNWLLMYGRTLATALAGDAALAAARAMGVTHTQWLSKRDPRVRETHRTADGQVRPVDGKFQVGAFRLRFPADPAVLPEGIREVANCFIAGTEVSAPDVEGSFRAPYVGDVVTICTTSGRILTGTPNHPILTERGWVGLGELHEGDYVVGARRGQNVSAGTDPHVEGSPALIEKVHDAIGAGLPARRIGRVAVDFYGDRPTGEVDVVATDRPLRFGRHASFRQHDSQSGLPWRSEAFEVSTSGGDSAAMQLGLRDAASSGVGISHQGSAPSIIQARPADTHCVTSTARLDTGSEEVASDDSARDAEAVSDRLLRLACEIASGQLLGIEHLETLAMTPRASTTTQGFASADQLTSDGGARYAELLADACRTLAGSVELDEVIEIHRSAFSGHVYTLQTGTGVYLAEGIVSRNCRCSLIFAPPSVDKRKALALVKAGTPAAARQLLAQRQDGWTEGAPELHAAAAPQVTVPAPVVAYRRMDSVPVEPGQQLSWPGALALALAPPAVAGATVLAVAIPAGMAVGVLGGAVILTAGVTLAVASVSAGQVVAQPVVAPTLAA